MLFYYPEKENSNTKQGDIKTYQRCFLSRKFEVSIIGSWPQKHLSVNSKL